MTLPEHLHADRREYLLIHTKRPPPKQKYQTCKEPALLYFEVRSALVRMNKNRAIDAVLIEMSLALNDFEIHKKRNIQQNLQKASENTSS